MSEIVAINFSGPYGVGKDSVISAIWGSLEAPYRPRSLTTRHSSTWSDPSYQFVSDQEFLRTTASGIWIINRQLSPPVYYATSLDELEAAFAAGRRSVLSVYAGPSGAGSLRRVLGRRLLSYGLLATGESLESELEELDQRLRSRGRESDDQLQRRLVGQIEKIQYVDDNPIVDTPDGPMPVFDEVLVNSDLAVATEAVLASLPDRATSQIEPDMWSDREVLISRDQMPDIGGSYLEDPEMALELGREIVRRDEIALLGSVLPLHAYHTDGDSFYLASLYRHLKSSVFGSERPFGVYRHARGHLLSAYIYGVERLADFELEVGKSMEGVAFVALRKEIFEGHLNL